MPLNQTLTLHTAENTGLREQASKNSGAFLSLIVIATWFGLVAGMIEGVGLLAFQHINWARWGPMIHVSRPIIWISPIVDVALFLIAGILGLLVAKLVSRGPALPAAFFLLSFLAVYDWLTLTGRLFHSACLLLAIGAAFACARWFRAHPHGAVRFFKRTLPAVLGLYVVALFAIEGGPWWRESRATAALPKAAPGAPNVVLIVIDTLRADHVSAYGYSRATTPNLDRLAAQGVEFQNAIAPSSWSLPSHVSLVTGRYMHDHKVGQVEREPWLGWGERGLGGLPTIGEALEARGYRTAAFSANRTYFSSDLGFGRGFIHFEDYFNSAADCFVRTLYGREFARIYLKRSDKSLVKRVLRRLGLTSLLDQDAEGSGSYGGAFGIRKHADEVNQELFRWIDRDRGRPFFAFLNYFDVHDPYGGPHSYQRPGWPEATDLDRYDSGVEYVDDQLGAFLASLGERGLADNTVIVVTSDHGESLGQHHLETHGRALYRELVHVPLVIWNPSRLPHGMKVDTPVSNAALAATILDLLGAPQTPFPGPGLDEIWNAPHSSMPPPLSELAANKYPGKRDAGADSLIPTATSGWMKSVVTPQWHLIAHQTLGAQIYDWVDDPGELDNLINTPEGQAAAKRLEPELGSASGP